MSWYNKGCSKRRGRQNDASRPQVKDEACGYLLSFGPEIEVHDPPEMREQITRLAESVLEFYKQGAISSKQAGRQNHTIGVILPACLLTADCLIRRAQFLQGGQAFASDG